MPRTLRALSACLITLHLLASASSADLWATIHNEIRGSQISSGTISVTIRDASSSDVPLVSVLWADGTISTDTKTPMIPASNMKLLTTGAALHVLGPDFDFTTRLLYDQGKLIIRGDGDPAFGDPELLRTMVIGDKQGLSVEEFLDLWIKPVVDAGLDISEIIVDDRIFEREFVHKTWPANQLNRRYCAEVSGLNFHLNVLHFYPTPGTDGQLPSIKNFEPFVNWLSPHNRASSKQGVHDKSDVWIGRQPGSNELTFYGNVKYAYRTPVPVTVHDMPDFFGHLFSDRLKAAGVQVGSYRLANKEDNLLEGEPIGPVIKTPISVALLRCNRDSQNLYAESLLKRTSYELNRQSSTWILSSGNLRLIVNERLNKGFVPPDLIVADGSGLSRDNRVSTDTLTEWLNSFYTDKRLGPMYLESFAVGGESGTLKKRFKNVNLHGAIVRAKSGYINEVSCLSGYIIMPDGRARTFSIMANGLQGPGAVRMAKTMQEKIIAAVAADMASMALTLGSD